MASRVLNFVFTGQDRLTPVAQKAGRETSGALNQVGVSVRKLSGEFTGLGAAEDAISAKGNKFKLVLAGINIASGVAEPALSGLVVAVGGLAAGFASAASALGAFGLVAKANITAASDAATKASAAQTAHTAAVAAANSKYSQAMGVATNKAQRHAAATARLNALQSAQAAKIRATTIAYAGLSPAQVGLSKSIGAMQDKWAAFTRSFAPMLNRIASTVKPLFGTILAGIGKLAASGGTAIQALLPSLGKALNSGGFQKFISMLSSNAGPAIVKLGIAIGHIAVGIGGILTAFMPVSQGMLSGIDKITAKFAAWGSTLTGHSGFQSLMQTFREETPQAVAILRNLGAVIGNIGRAMFGLSTFSNSKMLLSALLPASRVMASLSKNTDLVRLALYALVAVKIGQQFSWVNDAWKGVVKFAAVTEGATVSETIAAAATRAWGLAIKALPWVALAVAVVAVALLIVKYHAKIWDFTKRVWHDVLAVIASVFGWVKQNWPLILGIITGPIGLATGFVIRHWHMIRDTAVKAVNVIIGIFRTMIDVILNVFGAIIHGAATAFGWVYGIGGKLRGAAKAFDHFRESVDSSLQGIQDKTVNVSVAMTSRTNPYPGGIGGRAAEGGRIRGPGGPTSDMAGLFALSNDEYVQPAASHRYYGTAMMDAIRNRTFPRFAAGGGVGILPRVPGRDQVGRQLWNALVSTVRRDFTEGLGGGGNWPGVIQSALRLLGQSLAWVPAV